MSPDRPTAAMPAVEHAGTVLQGGDFRLRSWRMQDLDALLQHANDAQVARGLSERFPHPYTEADGLAFLRGQVVDLDTALAIEVQGQACGGIGARLGAGERAHGAELGYWLGRAHWGRGLMRAVVALYLPWLMQRHGLRRVHATVLDFNQASARVLLHNGLREEGIERAAIFKHGRLHDLRRFALVR